MEFVLFIALLLGVLFAPRILRSYRRNKLIAFIKGFSQVPISQFFVQNDGQKGIGISIPAKSIVYFSSPSMTTVFQAREILNCEIYTSNHSKSKHPLGSVVGRYVIGKALGGSSFGETLGKTGQAKISHVINGVELLISTSRPSKPTFSIIVLENGEGKIGQRAYKSGHYIKSLIESLK